MSYPLGVYPVPTGSRLRARACRHCGLELGVGRWNDLNGFLVRCPHCGGLHGKKWNARRTVVAGLLFNALSYPFVMRFRPALVVIGVTVASVLSFGMLVDLRTTPDWLAATAFGTFFLAPCVVNGVLLLRHQTLLEQSPLDRSQRQPPPVVP